MKRFSLLLLFASVLAAAQPPSLPAGTHSAGESQTVVDAQPAALDAAEDAMVKHDWSAALSLLQKILAENPAAPEDRARSNYDVGFCDEALGKPVEAIAAYRSAIAADAKQFEAHAALGRLLVAQEKSADGRAELETASQLIPAAGDVHTAKADVYRALARVDLNDNAQAASADLIEALKLSPETLQDKLLSAEIAEASGDLPAAEAAYREALINAPDSIQAAASMAHLLIKEKKYSEAVSFAEHVHAVIPDDADVTRLLANLYLETGDLAKASALDATLLATSQGSKDPALYLSRGEALLRQHDYAGAQNAYQQATALDSKLVDAWSGLAFAATENHQYPVALQALTMRSKLETDTPAALFLWATTYDNLRQYKSAMQYYRLFLAVAKGGFPDQEFEARHRLLALEKQR